jgi:hypothetical protein
MYSIDNSNDVYGTLVFPSLLSVLQLDVIQAVILLFSKQKSRLCLFIVETKHFFFNFLVVTGDPSIHSNQGLQ